jgi:Holliday junction resolvase RusA-like endonuclease
MIVSFDVVGVPRPQGSKQAFSAGNGKARMKEAGGLEFAAWRNAVAEAARREAEKLDGPLDGMLRLRVTFRFPMPKSRPKWMRECGMVPKTTAPDTSKLVRCVEDAFQAAGLIVDDAWTGAELTIVRANVESSAPTPTP